MNDLKVIEVIKKIHNQEKRFFWNIPIKDNRGNIVDYKKSHFRSIDDDTGKFLMSLIVSSKAKKVLELGCSAGCSSLWMSIGSNLIGGHIYTTELFDEKIKTAKTNFNRAGVNKLITIYRGDIKEILHNWKQGKIDMVFIDADKKQYPEYYDFVFPLLKKDGFIVIDNVISHRSEIKEFLSKMYKNKQIKFVEIAIGSGIMIIFKLKKSNSRL